MTPRPFRASGHRATRFGRLRWARRQAVGTLALVHAACATVPRQTLPGPGGARLAASATLVTGSPRDVGLDPALPARLDSIMRTAVAQGTAPGAALAVGRYGRLVHLRGYGRIDWSPGAPAATPATLYDLASLTKVVATTTAAMILEEEGRLDLDRAVRDYLPAFDAPDKAAITPRMLLTHRGGLEAGAELYTRFQGRDEYLSEINRRPLSYAPGTGTLYSDWDMVLLQLVIERITGMALDAYVEARVFAPLGMGDTRFNPDPALRPRTAPTAIDTSRGGLLWGVVHDPNAWALGGVSGHAGLFSTARDLAIFAQFLLNGGQYGGTRLVRAATVARWTARQGGAASRALGWDTPTPGSSAGRYFSPRSFGHTGFTGTSLWVDPERGVFVVLLTNRVHSRGESPVPAKLRRDVADAVQQAIVDAPLLEWESR